MDQKLLTDRWIAVRIGKEFSTKYLVENGTPQGSIVSPVLFSIMINKVFSRVDRSISVTLYADDIIMWKKGRNVEYIVRKMQEAIGKVECWGREWGFRFSVAKTKVVCFSQRKNQEQI